MTTSDLEPQYRELKRRDPDLILLFRVGGFYRAIHDDAKEVRHLIGSRLIPLWMNHRMAQFGAVRLEEVLSLIVAAGRRAAVLERVSDDGRPKGTEVKRIVTEGNFDV